MNPAMDLPDIFRAALERVDPHRMVREAVSLDAGSLFIRCGNTVVRENLASYDRIVAIGIGKAACGMARAVEEALGDRLDEGLVLTKYGHGQSLSRIRVVEASHPVPDENGMNASRCILHIAQEASERTLVLCLVSGGGSALFTLPAEGLSLPDKQSLTETLLASGATIDEINTVRKHLSRVKGGRLARTLHPARTISLVLSDVVGDRLDTIASGVTAPDATTFAQAQEILARYAIENLAPRAAREIILKGVRGEIPETPKEDDPAFARVTNLIVGNNRSACEAARERGEALGYHTRVLAQPITGEASRAGSFFAGLARDIASGRFGLPRPALLVAGGETTVTVRGTGRGGRNQEMALAFLADMARTPLRDARLAFLSAGTDGTDGPTEAAGAMVTSDLVRTVVSRTLDPLAFLGNNDSNGFFRSEGGLFVTGPTGTNVCDIQLLAVI